MKKKKSILTMGIVFSLMLSMTIHGLPSIVYAQEDFSAEETDTNVSQELTETNQEETPSHEEDVLEKNVEVSTLQNDEQTNPDGEIPESIDFKLEDWVYNDSTGRTIDLYRPNKELKAKSYVIPGSYNGIQIRLGSDRLFSGFQFDGKLLVDNLTVGTVDDKVILPVNYCSHWFFNGIRETTIKNLDLRGLDVSKITNMSFLFNQCKNLETLDLRGWDVSNVENMQGMFSYCTNLKEIRFDDWNTSNVTNMIDMFTFCKSLKYANIDVFNMEKVYSINGMFSNSSITSTEKMENWNVSNVQYMNTLFRDCEQLETVDLANWDTSNVKDMSYMFWFATEGSVSPDTPSNIVSIKGLEKWDVSNVEKMRYMFAGCKKLDAINLENWKPKKVTDMGNMFYKCTSLSTVNLRNWEINNAVDMSSMFKECRSLTTLEGLNGWNFVPNAKYGEVRTMTDMSSMFNSCTSLKSLEGVENWNTSNVENTAVMFMNCINLSSIEQLENWNVSNVKSMSHMFFNCSGLKSLIGLQNWNVSNVENMGGMFFGCFQLRNLDELANWNTAKVKVMGSTFSECFGLTNLNGLRNWNVGNVEGLGGMFALCPNIKTLEPLKNWDVKNAQDFTAMFFGCINLNSVEVLANWKPNNVESIVGMFALCKNIEDFTTIEKWEMPKLKGLQFAFMGCEKLKTLDMSKWKLDLEADEINISGMFNHCPNLLLADFALLDDFQGKVVAENVFDTAGECEFALEIMNMLAELKAGVGEVYPGADPNEVIPVDETQFNIEGVDNIPLMVLANHEGLRNSLNSSENNGRIKYSFDILYDGNGRVFTTDASTNEDVITATNFAYSNENAVVEDFVSIINEKGNALVENVYVDWYLDNACTNPVSNFDFIQQVDKDIKVFAKYSAQVSYDFISAYQDKTLPQGVLDQLPKSVTVDCGTTVVPTSSNFETVPDGNGFWEFSHWDRNKIENIQTHQTITGVWVYKENGIGLNHIPTINANDITLTVGDTFDSLKDVTATDKEDGDLTKEIEILKNTVDTTKVGVYEVTYKVTDTQGASVTKTIKVIVKDKDVKPIDPTKPNTDKNDVNTGDSTNLGLYTSLLAMSGLFIAILVVWKKKKALKNK